MRLATFNVLHGRRPGDGSVSTARLAEACRTLDADVLGLQEVDRGQARSEGADQAAEVARATGAAAWRFEPALIGEPGADWRPATDGDAGAAAPEPGYGVALVSRRHVSAWHVLRLPAAPVRAPVAVPGGRGRFLMLPDEPRVVLVADLGEMLVATTHLSFVPGYNLVQLWRLTRRLGGLAGPADPAEPAAEPRPCVLLGDLNVPAPVPAAVTGWRPLARLRTYPADRPLLQVDHVLGRGRLGEVRAAEARLLPLSDHRAVVVDLPG